MDGRVFDVTDNLLETVPSFMPSMPLFAKGGFSVHQNPLKSYRL